MITSRLPRTLAARLILALLLVLSASPAFAQCVSLTTIGSASTQSFDTLATAGTNIGWTDNTSLPGWYSTRITYNAGTGSSNTGALYSFGVAGANPVTDRALGGVASGGTGTFFWAVCFVNNTGAALTSLDISYIGEQWRDGLPVPAAAHAITFEYQVAAAGVITDADTPTTGWTALSSLDFTGPQTGTAAGALDGNLAANRTLRSASPAVSVASGNQIWLRWRDINDASNDHGLAIDDFSLTPQGGAVTPTLNISDVTLAEGDPPGTTTFTFSVTLTAPAGAGGVSFDIATADGTAQDDNPVTEDNDYVAQTLTGQSIGAGLTGPYQFSVTVNRDTTNESNETFFVNVTNILGANPGDTQGLGTITNDDVTPTLNISDVSQAETHAGTTLFTFNVTLSSPAGAGGVSFDIATADGTAQDGNPGGEDTDYVGQILTGQSIGAGLTGPYPFSVTVNGDTTVEPNETFFVNVTNIVGANPGDTQGQGTINNDDVTLTPIHDIQGSGASSPIVGASVTTSGIVTGVKSNGFFIQDGSADADPLTSEGIFVFTSSAPPAAAAIGNAVQVTGTVAEFVPTSDPLQPPLTELTAPTVTVMSSGNALPAPVTLTATLPDPAGAHDQLERLEGMRVFVGSLTVVAPTLGFVSEANATSTSSGVFFGVVTGVARPFRESGIQEPDLPPSGSSPPIPRFDSNPERIRVDSDGLVGGPLLDVGTGAVVTGLIGPLDYTFRTYTILPDPSPAPPPVATGGPTPTAVANPGARELTVASFNVFHFYDTVNDVGTSDAVLTAAAFEKRLNKASLAIRDYLKTPDVLAVIEMENLPTLQSLATRINSDAVVAAQPDPQYAPYLMEGNDIGGIDVGFLVKTALVTGSTPRVFVNAVVQENALEQFVNPDATTSLLNDRPSLRLDAVINHANGSSFPVTVIVNHLRSLNGVNSTDPGSNGWASEGDRVRAKRQKQAESLANLVQARQTANPAERIILVGDFNAFEFNDGFGDSMNIIAGLPPPDNQTVVPGDGVDLVNPDLDNLFDTRPPAERYTYVFDGNAQNLDHIVINQSLISDTAARRIEHPRIDADFPDTARNDGTTPTRLSDHEAIVGYFEVASFAIADLSITKTESTDPVIAGTNLAYTITVANSGPDAAATVSWSDTIPAGTTFVSLPSVAGWSCATPAVGASGGVSCFNPSFAVGSAPFTLTVAVHPSVLAGVVLSTTATVTSTTSDPDSGDTSAIETTTVAASADLSTTKGDSPDPVTVGTNLTYTVTLNNAGPSDAASASLSDTLPAGTTFVSLSSAAGWSCTTPAVGSGGTVSCSIAAFGASSSAIFTLTVAVAPGLPGGTVLTNTATASSATSDPNPGNESGIATTTVFSPAGVTGSKTVSGTLTPGGSITYTVILSNSGGSSQGDNPGNEFIDGLPSQLSLVSATATSGTATATVATNVVTWNGAVPAGGSVTITIAATINSGTAGATIANQGTINYDADGNGTNEASGVTDDPGTGTTADPTSFLVSASPTTTTAANATAGYNDAAQNVTLTATVTGGTINEGTVTFTVKTSGGATVGTPVTSPTVSGGSASATYVLPGGTLPQTLTILADYVGAGQFANSSDATKTLIVGKAATTTTAANATAAYDDAAQNITLTATVAGSTVNEGTVTFTVKTSGGTTVGTPVTSAALTTGNASATYVLPGGTLPQTLTILAEYAGVDKFANSSDATKTLTVGKAPTTTTAANATAAYNDAAQNITLTALVAGSTVNEGTVTFTVKTGGGTTVGSPVTSAALTNGNASVTYVLPGGTLPQTLTILAEYAGVDKFANSSDATKTLTVGKAVTTTTAANATAVYNDAAQNITLTATVAGSTVNEGTVTFTVKTGGGATVGTPVTPAALTNGNASVTYVLPGGTLPQTLTILAEYAGVDKFANSSDATKTLIVGKTATTTTAANATAAYNDAAQNITLTATVAGSTVNEGTVTFTVKTGGGTTVGTPVTSAALTNGNASATYVLPGGTVPQTLTITASYTGVTKFADSSDATKTLIVGKTATTTTAANATTAYNDAAQNITLTATVAGSTVNEGTVTFTVRTGGGTTVGTPVTSAALTNGNASATYVLPGGTLPQTLTITASYTGVTRFADSSDATKTLIVGKAVTTTSAANATAAYNDAAQNITLTATVTGSTVNEGTVTFTVRTSGGTTVGTPVASAALTAGNASATYVLPGGTLPQTLTITASYTGIVKFADSSDATKTLTVGKTATTTTVANTSATSSATAQNVTLNATVTGSVVNEGTVTFTVKTSGGTTVGTPVTSAALTNGSASATYSLPGGTAPQTLRIEAAYAGGVKFLPSAGIGSLVTGCSVIDVVPATLPNATVGSAYSQTLTASGGVAPYTFAPIGPLPAPFTLTSAGVLSGTPTATGSHTITIRATDAVGCTGTRTYTLVVDPVPINLTLNTPNGASSFAADTSFYLLSGLTDPGVTITTTVQSADEAEPRTGRTVQRESSSETRAGGTVPFIVELPLLAGTNQVTVTATNGAGQSVSQRLTITLTTLAYPLAEGASGPGFQSFLLIANPNATPATATVTYLKEDGTTTPHSVSVPPQSRVTVPAAAVPGVGVTAFATQVTIPATQPLVVERSSFFDSTYHAGTTSGAENAASTTWYFAEGSRLGTFSTYLLLGNTGATPATVTATFMTETGLNVTRSYVVGATSRLTVPLSSVPELAQTSFGIVVLSDVPVTAERAQYFGPGFKGGHATEGTPVLSTLWYHAEGKTGPVFDTYVLLLNPNAAPATATLTFRTDDGVTVVKTRTLPARSRATVIVRDEDPALRDAAVWTTVVSDLPIVSERSMYWPGASASWSDGHNSVGANEAATKWAFAEGASGRSLGFDTYYLLANPTAVAADVTLTFLREGGSPIVHTVRVPARGRFTLSVNTQIPALANQSFGAVITSTAPVVIERSMYWTSQGVPLSGGASSGAIRIP